jgi:hypothetical protein
MIQDTFGAIIDELGKILKTRLAPDAHNACKLKYKSGLTIQIDFNSANEKIELISSLGTPIPGRYRENLFREALKANGLPFPKYGVFAYSKKQDALVLYDHIPLKELSGQKLADFLTPFAGRADLWSQAIAKGEVPSFTGTEFTFSKSPGSGMFGL